MSLSMRNSTIVAVVVSAGLLVLFSLTPAARRSEIATRLGHLPSRPAPTPATNEKKPVDNRKFNGTWDASRDSRNLLLSSTQCEQAFPGLFDELDKQVARTKKAGTVTRTYMMDVEATAWDAPGFISGYIYDSNLYITNMRMGRFTRPIAVVASMLRAINTSPGLIPNIQFTFYTSDSAHNKSTWGLTRPSSDTQTWLMPDFGYWSWPEPKVSSYGEVRRRARQVEEGHPPSGSPTGSTGVGETAYTWANKHPQLVWRGAAGLSPTRSALLAATAHQPWADVKTIDWSPGKGHKDILRMSDHCKYKFVAHTAGSSYSGRLKYLQNCRSVVVAHRLNYTTHDNHLLRASGPDQNFVEVERDFRDLAQKMAGLLADDARAERIADNSARTFRDHYLSPAAETCYWRRLIRGWSEVSEPPIPWMGKENTVDWNGVPAEDFLLMHKTDWEQH